MLSVFKFLLPTLAVLALGGLQLFGAPLGYICDHQEQAVNTVAEHCHRTDIGIVPCANGSENDRQERDSGREQHEPAVVELKISKSSFSTLTIPPYVAVMVAELPSLEDLRSLTLSELSINNVPPDTIGDSPPAAVQVARCMVMLI